MEKINLTTLKKSLEKKTKKELIQEISELYKNFPAVKDYYQFQAGDTKVILEKYKDIIKKEFVDGYARGLPKVRFNVAKKAVQDFKRFTQDPELLADIMFTYVEAISDFNKQYGPDSETFYTSPENMFEKVLILLKKNKLLSVFQRRVYRIVENATDAWGYSGALEECYEEFYGGFIR